MLCLERHSVETGSIFSASELFIVNIVNVHRVVLKHTIYDVCSAELESSFHVHIKFVFTLYLGSATKHKAGLTNKQRKIIWSGSMFIYNILLVHGQVTIIFVVSLCLFVCLFLCLCRVFLSRLRSDLDQTRTHVTCPGLVVSRRI